MRKYFVIGFVICIAIFACKKDVVPEYPQILVYSIEPDTASYGDTLTLTLGYKFCNPSPDLKVFIDSIPVDIVENVDGNLIKVVVPVASKSGYTEIVHPKARNIEYFTRKSNLKITGINPEMGKAGTIVTVKGFDFQFGYRTRFFINNNSCTLISLNDTMALIEIPEGCGSGLIQILVDDNIGTCTGYSFEGNLFNSLFDEKTQALKYIMGDGYSFEYFRDEQGRAIKEIYSGGSYQVFSYGNEGLLDTIYLYTSPQEMIKFSVVSREDFNSKIIVDTYNTNNLQYKQFLYRDEYYYSNGIMQGIKVYRENGNTGNMYLYYSSSYSYSNQNRNCEAIIKRYDSDGNQIENYTDSYIYDIFNKKLDIGIPGFPESHSYTLIPQNDKLIFNNFGNLVEAQHRHHVCHEFEPNMQYIYE